MTKEINNNLPAKSETYYTVTVDVHARKDVLSKDAYRSSVYEQSVAELDLKRIVQAVNAPLDWRLVPPARSLQDLTERLTREDVGAKET